MLLSLFPIWIVEQYNLKTLTKDSWVHLEMRHTVWGLAQAGILANKPLQQNLAPFGYYKCINTPSLWYHKTCPITFTLIVDNFGVKFIDKADVDHLIASIKMTYILTKDWTGDLYCGTKLGWDYVNWTIDISMPGCIKKNFKSMSMSFRQSLSIVSTHLS